MSNNSEPEIIAGRTIVSVQRRDEDEKGKLKPPREIHRGIVVANYGSFVRVFNPAPRDKGGDLNPVVCESFPVVGKRCWCEIVNTRSPVDAFPIPPEFR